MAAWPGCAGALAQGLLWHGHGGADPAAGVRAASKPRRGRRGPCPAQQYRAPAVAPLAAGPATSARLCKPRRLQDPACGAAPTPPLQRAPAPAPARRQCRLAAPQSSRRWIVPKLRQKFSDDVPRSRKFTHIPRRNYLSIEVRPPLFTRGRSHPSLQIVSEGMCVKFCLSFARMKSKYFACHQMRLS